MISHNIMYLPNYGVPFIAGALCQCYHHRCSCWLDPYNELIEGHLALLQWDYEQRKFGLTGAGLQKVHALSVDLLDILEENLPERAGGILGWNFEKPHSINHKVRDIILLGWSEIFGHQGPEHGHIDNIKNFAGCINNKEIYLQVLKAHARAGHLSYLRNLEVDLADAAADDAQEDAEEDRPSEAKFDLSVETGSCELGLRYPTLQAIFGGKRTKQRIQVRRRTSLAYMMSYMISYVMS